MSDSEVIVKPTIKPTITPKEKVAAPSMYVVVLHNDAMTPRAFVVMALKTCFQKIESEAQTIMMTAHENGHAVVNSYTREIAETKAAKANDFSAKHGFVLLFTAEKQ